MSGCLTKVPKVNMNTVHSVRVTVSSLFRLHGYHKTANHHWTGIQGNHSNFEALNVTGKSYEMREKRDGNEVRGKKFHATAKTVALLSNESVDTLIS